MSDKPILPLPEVSFKFRRIFTWSVSSILLVFLATIIWQIDGDRDLRIIALAIIVLLWWVVSVYMIGPTAENMTKMVQSAAMVKATPGVLSAAEKVRDVVDPTARQTPDDPEGD